MSNKILGYRGYVGSRSYSGIDFPQNIQNFLIRSYCEKKQLVYLLSATEYTMSGCYMILEQVINSIQTVEGIILFSIFMLPGTAEKRKRIYHRILSAGKTLHAALEDIVIRNLEDIPIIENILDVNQIALTDQSLPMLREFCTE